jgi:Protein of unknown function (DUF1570)
LSNKSKTYEAMRIISLIAPVVTAGCSFHHFPTLTFPESDFRVTDEAWTTTGQPGAHLTTDNFEIYSTCNDRNLTRYLPGFLETTHQLYTSLLAPADSSPKPHPKLKTYLFGTRKEWEHFVKKRFPERYPLYRRISAGGFTEGSVSVIYDIGRAATLSVVAHEGLHQYLASHFTDPIPAWVNEGLATYCESVEFRDDKPYFLTGRNTFRINHMRNALAEGRVPTLRQLLRTDAGEVIKGNRIADTGTYYAHAWALVTYLRHAAPMGDRAGFRKLLEGIRSGTIRIKSQAAKVASMHPAETSYGEAAFYAYITDDLDDFDKKFNKFLRKLCGY